jgi:ketosteroid isomerase-like protein
MTAENPIDTVKALDRCWRERKFDELADLLAPNIVVVGSHGRRFTGRDAALAGYRDFMTNSEVRSYTPTNYIVTSHGDAAVVEYEWAMQWTSGEQSHDGRGREFLTLSRTDGRRQIIWRMQLSASA